jgi:hypothetical protein
MICARIAQGSRKGTGLSQWLHARLRKDRKEFYIYRAHEKKNTRRIFLFFSVLNNAKTPCGPCAANNNAANLRNNPCAKVAQSLRREGI